MYTTIIIHVQVHFLQLSYSFAYTTIVNGCDYLFPKLNYVHEHGLRIYTSVFNSLTGWIDELVVVYTKIK